MKPKGASTDPNGTDEISRLLAKLEREAMERLGMRPPRPPEQNGAGETAADSGPDVRQFVQPSGQQEKKKPRAAKSYRKGSILLDTYRVESGPINGGMGSVWRVRHLGWHTDLALMRPREHLFGDEKAKERFIRECESWINLGLHPNIVSCYYVREMDGVPSIFSEWMEGGSLESHIQQGTLYGGTGTQTQARLLDIAIQFARGLRFAHDRGLIHQDVKPDNLLLTVEWDAKVSDFGLANARAQQTVREDGENGAGSIVATSGGYTPAYCSMEQMDGRPLTRRTDIYSWAVSVMEMYVGGRPWMNGVVAGLNCGDYLNRCRVPMPEALKTLLMRCMDAEVDRRPHDFAVIEEELKSIYRAATGEAYLRPAAKASPDTADSLNNRALSFLDLGRLDDALALWRRAVREDNSNFRCHYNMAVALWSHNRISAEELRKRIIAQKEDTPQWRQAMDASAFAVLNVAENVQYYGKPGGRPDAAVLLEPIHEIPRYRMSSDRPRKGKKFIHGTSLDGSRTLYWDQETQQHIYRDEKGRLTRYDTFRGKNVTLEVVDEKCEIAAGGYDPLDFFNAKTGRSLVTQHCRLDNEGDPLGRTVEKYSANGYVYTKDYSGGGTWIKLPPADPQMAYMLSRVASFAQREDAMRRLAQCAPEARRLLEKGDCAGAYGLLAPFSEDGTLLMHEPALEVWEALYPHCVPGKLITVLPREDKFSLPGLRCPAQPPKDPPPGPWGTNRASDGAASLSVSYSTRIYENYNNGMDVNIDYTFTAHDAATGKLYFILSFQNCTDDSRMVYYDYDVKLSGQFLWLNQPDQDRPFVCDLADPGRQRALNMRLALPGGCFLENKDGGVSIGGFAFEDEFIGLAPLWDQPVIPCKNKTYHLIYQYTGIREE